MPFSSAKQRKFIYAKAGEGEQWAKKFVKESHGTHVEKMHSDVHNAMRSMHNKKKGK